jgi:hypothetical protein
VCFHKSLYTIVIKGIADVYSKNTGQKKYPSPVREKGISWSDVSVFLRPAILVSVAVLPRLVVIIPLNRTIASLSGQKTTNIAIGIILPTKQVNLHFHCFSGYV